MNTEKKKLVKYIIRERAAAIINNTELDGAEGIHNEIGGPTCQRECCETDMPQTDDRLKATLVLMLNIVVEVDVEFCV